MESFLSIFVKYMIFQKTLSLSLSLSHWLDPEKTIHERKSIKNNGSKGKTTFITPFSCRMTLFLLSYDICFCIYFFTLPCLKSSFSHFPPLVTFVPMASDTLLFVLYPWKYCHNVLCDPFKKRKDGRNQMEWKRNTLKYKTRAIFFTRFFEGWNKLRAFSFPLSLLSTISSQKSYTHALTYEEKCQAVHFLRTNHTPSYFHFQTEE